MKAKHLRRFVCLTIVGAFIAPLPASAEEGSSRRIEEVVVTAEKRESTVSDTSISITAFDSQMIENLGLQSADELVDFLPATTRDAYDIRIRGVGRNFRALGGDPGVATYYNGVYSPDFGIAASENALYDLERIEVLRGPQGTLYGRNSIGGALNYVTKRPTMDVEGEVRAQLGKYDTREFYGVLSGPIIQDRLAARLVANKRDRDGHQKGVGDAPDTDAIDDRNVSLALLWQVTDDIQWNARVNDRKSDRVIGNSVLLDLGAGPVRSMPSVDRPVNGLRCNPSVAPGYCQAGAPTTDATTPGAMAFTNPNTGATVWGAYNRPGIDQVGWPGQPNSFYMQDPALRPLGLSAKKPRNETQVNDDPNCDDFPYTDCNSNHELFEHRSLQSDITWDLSDTTSLKYIYGYTDFDYTFNTDLDNTDADFTAYRQTVLEDVWNQSHELQLNWGIGEKFTATSGVYYFQERRNQDYS
ncbi:MAG TPA: TonB-dependent receptor plug domain-containing protein, partial [Pseudomonadales bacterium]